jgi:hypothetical protein
MKRLPKFFIISITLFLSSTLYGMDCPAWHKEIEELKNLQIIKCVSVTIPQLQPKKDHLFIITKSNLQDNLTVSIFSITEGATTKLIYQQNELGTKILPFHHQGKEVVVAFGDFTKSQSFHFAILTQQEANKTLLIKKLENDKFKPIGYKYQVDLQWVEVPSLLFENEDIVSIGQDNIYGRFEEKTTEYRLREGYYVHH